MITLEKFTPWGNKYLVKPLPAKEQTAGGIYIPGTAAMEGEEAEIILIGEHATKGNIGEIVLYATGAGWSLTVNGIPMRVIPQESIEGLVG